MRFKVNLHHFFALHDMPIKREDAVIPNARPLCTIRTEKGDHYRGDDRGSACGPLEGFGPGHIRSIFGRITDYTDPSPALKGKPERWRKPGLYSSISQMIMLMLLSAGRGRGIDMRSFVRELENNPPVEGHPFGAFRHPGVVERGLIERPSRGPETVPSTLRERRPSWRPHPP